MSYEIPYEEDTCMDGIVSDSQGSFPGDYCDAPIVDSAESEVTFDEAADEVSALCLLGPSDESSEESFLCTVGPPADDGFEPPQPN